MHYAFSHPQHLSAHTLQCHPLKLSLHPDRVGDIRSYATPGLKSSDYDTAPNRVKARMPVYDDWGLQSVLCWLGPKVLDGWIERGLVRGLSRRRHRWGKSVDRDKRCADGIDKDGFISHCCILALVNVQEFSASGAAGPVEATIECDLVRWSKFRSLWFQYSLLSGYWAEKESLVSRCTWWKRYETVMGGWIGQSRDEGAEKEKLGRDYLY